jgi:8-oxo-dGTP pyrophosphatase MutT (NUDIX family)
MQFEESAGGVVYKIMQGQVYILIAQHAAHKGWGFPKGHIGDKIQGEGKEDTALREVAEETGVTARIEQALSPITYFYVWEGKKRKKTVYFYLMEFISEDPSKKDTEMSEVGWFPEQDVLEKLTYPTEKKLWQEARQLIAASH